MNCKSLICHNFHEGNDNNSDNKDMMVKMVMVGDSCADNDKIMI